MIYSRLYIQFNDLVFDGKDMLTDWDDDSAFKGGSIERSYGHGSYRPFKKNYLFASEKNVTVPLTMHMRKLPCEYRQYYVRFVDEQLVKPGKLWSIKNGELQWAYAAVEDISVAPENTEEKLVYDVSFILPEGIWHKADKQKTFLLPWDICTFMDCMGYKTYQPCTGSGINGDCCEICIEKAIEETEDCSCCCVDEITKDMALCYHLKELTSMYGCERMWQIKYDCERAYRFNEYVGQRLCTEDVCDDSVIAGRFYSETEIPTEGVEIRIEGTMTNPWVTINGNTNIIKGEYDGTLIVKENGDVYYQKDKCCEPELLDPSVWIIPKGNVYGWTVYPQNNRIVVHLNACCSGDRACVTINHDALAF